MTTPLYNVNANGLSIPNPLRPLAAILLAFSGGLIVLAIAAAIICMASPGSNGPGWYLTWLAVGAASIYSASLLFQGLRARLDLNVPIPVPGNLGGAETTLTQVLFHKAIPVAVHEPGLFHLLVQTLWPHCRNLPPAPRALVDSLHHRVWPLLPAVALLGVVTFCGGPVLFPVLSVVVLLFALAAHVLAVAKLRPNRPRVETCEAKIGPITDAGHPDSMHHHNQAVLRLTEDSGFPNRMIRDEHTILPQGGRNSFETHVVFETQPMPLEWGDSATSSARILQVACIPLVLAGWGLLLFLFWFSDAIVLGLAVLTGLMSVVLAESLLGLALRLMCCFRFRSDVFWVRMHGTFTESTIAMHPSSSSTFSTSKQVVQSEIFLELRATRLLTECSCIPVLGDAGLPGWRTSATKVLQAPRYALDALGRDELFLARLRSFLEKICSYSDQGRRLAVPDLTQRDLQDLVAINIRMTQAQAPSLLPVAIFAPALYGTGSPVLPHGGQGVGAQGLLGLAPTPPVAPAVPRMPGPTPASQEDRCSVCGFRAPGARGMRYCLVCDRNF